MALSTAAKSAIGLGTAGGVASSAAGINYLLSDRVSSIRELIKSKNPEKRLLDKNSSDAAGKAAWKGYRTFNQNKDKDIGSIEGWTTGVPQDNEEVPDAFKKGCESRIAGSSKLYDEVISYCTRKTILADLVKESSGRTLLAKESGGSSAAWKAVWVEYKKSDTTYTNGKDAWKIATGSSIHSSENAPDAFMDKCKTNSETEGHNPVSELYKQLLKYCTTEIKQ